MPDVSLPPLTASNPVLNSLVLVLHPICSTLAACAPMAAIISMQPANALRVLFFITEPSLKFGFGAILAAQLAGLVAVYSLKMPSSVCRFTSVKPTVRKVSRMRAGGAQASMLSQ